MIGIELLVAAQGCDFLRPLTTSTALEAVRATLREQVPTLTDDRYLHPEIAAATALVRDGAIQAAIGDIALPGVCEAA